MLIKRLQQYHIFLLFLFCLLSFKGFSQLDSLSAEEKKSLYASFSDANERLDYWYDSRYGGKGLARELNISQWYYLLEYFYADAERNHDTITLRRIAYPLSVTYHSLTQFDKALPLLEYMRENKASYKEIYYQNILVMLEEEYRAMGNLKKAVDIRRERINLNYIQSFYDLYADAQLYDIAINDFKNLELAPEPTPFNLTLYYQSLGDLFYKAEQLDSAITYYEKGIATLKPILNAKDYEGRNWYSEYTKVYFTNKLKGNIASAHVKKGEFNDVVPALELDIESSREIKEVDNRIVKWLVLGNVYLKQNRLKEARDVLDSVRHKIQGKKMIQSELEQLRLEGQYFKQVQMPDSSTFYLDKYIVLNDSLATLNKKNQAVLLLASFDNATQKNVIREQRLELERKENLENISQLQTLLMIIGLVGVCIVIVLVIKNYKFKKKTRSKIEKQNDELKLKNEENTLLLKEVHHRVKNNLQTISSLLGLQGNSVKDENVKIAFIEGQNRVHSMALIHKRLYEGENLGAVAFEDYANQLCDNLITSFGKTQVVKYSINSSVYMDMEHAVPLGLIINEIVTNILKYAQNKDGAIRFEMSMELKNEHYKLNIRDHGEGFDVQKVKLKNSLGLRLIELLSRQLEGQLKISSNTNGTAYNLSFPQDIKT